MTGWRWVAGAVIAGGVALVVWVQALTHASPVVWLYVAVGVALSAVVFAVAAYRERRSRDS